MGIAECQFFITEDSSSQKSDEESEKTEIIVDSVNNSSKRESNSLSPKRNVTFKENNEVIQIKRENSPGSPSKSRTTSSPSSPQKKINRTSNQTIPVSPSPPKEAPKSPPQSILRSSPPINRSPSPKSPSQSPPSPLKRANLKLSPVRSRDSDSDTGNLSSGSEGKKKIVKNKKKTDHKEENSGKKEIPKGKYKKRVKSNDNCFEKEQKEKIFFDPKNFSPDKPKEIEVIISSFFILYLIPLFKILINN